jgi:hypothetical protein
MLGNVLDHLTGILVQRRVVFHDEKALMVLHQDDNELKGGDGAAHILLGDVPVQPAEGPGTVVPDKEDSIPLEVEVTVDGIHQLFS